MNLCYPLQCSHPNYLQNAIQSINNTKITLGPFANEKVDEKTAMKLQKHSKGLSSLGSFCRKYITTSCVKNRT